MGGVMRSGTKIVATGTTAALLLAGPAALGSTRRISDPNDVPRRRVDVKSASHSHLGGRLKHTIVAFKAFRTSRGPCVTFETNGRGDADYRVCGLGNMTDLKEQVSKPVVSIRRPNPRTIVYVFRKKAIGSPGRYRWFVKEPGPNDCEICDRAPNSGMVTHDI
ncbi:MAG: hypothetical protein M3198_11065 [Actinomycetota bacterium]|nr:hypothetical protein [Actinomycetota bacterium]